MKAKELSEKSKKELMQDLEKIQKELFSMRMKKAASHLENPVKLRYLKKDVARIKTIIHLKDLESIKDKIK